MKNEFPQNAWTLKWLNSVADGTFTMSQRRMISIDKKGGGLKAVRILAKEKGVHLLRFEDDQGVDLVAASVKPFHVIC